jgi:hypothetical protein
MLSGVRETYRRIDARHVLHAHPLPANDDAFAVLAALSEPSEPYWARLAAALYTQNMGE